MPISGSKGLVDEMECRRLKSSRKKNDGKLKQPCLFPIYLGLIKKKKKRKSYGKRVCLNDKCLHV